MKPTTIASTIASTITAIAGPSFRPSVYGRGEIIYDTDRVRVDRDQRDIDAERAADRIDLASVMAGFGWDDDQLSRARMYAFPTSTASSTDRRGRRTHYYSRAAVTTWAKSLVTFASTVG